VAAVVVGLRDVHEQTQARHALAASELLFRTAMKSSLVGMALTSLSGGFQVVNPALCQLLGREESWMLEHGADDVIHPEDVAAVRADRARLGAGEVDELITEMRLVRSDGATLWTRRSAAVIRDQAGRPERLVLQWEDLTVQHHAQERLAHQAFHDPLTGLRNRAWMLDMLEFDLAAADRDEGAVGLLFIDLDDLKAVNDSLGHAVGDEVLCAVAHRIVHSLRPNDHAGRFGGDEFVVSVSGVRDREQLEQVAARISGAVSQEFQVFGHRLVPTVSIGMAISRPGMRPTDLLHDTDSALYQAKADGRNCWRFFDQPTQTP
jgi:diguanylate cyclase (GGDEF)-like protein/PAS domain S-box-containing protein